MATYGPSTYASSGRLKSLTAWNSTGHCASSTHDEIGYLALECEAMGAAWIGPIFFAALERRFANRPCDRLIAVYGGFRALLRARLLEMPLRKPEKWRPLALTYLKVAKARMSLIVSRECGKRGTGVQPSNGFGKKWCAAYDLYAVAQNLIWYMKWRSRVRHDRSVNCRMSQNRLASSVKEGMCGESIHSICTPLAAGLRRSQCCLACPDHVVDDKDLLPFDATCEKVTGDDPTAATLFHDRELCFVARQALIVLSTVAPV